MASPHCTTDVPWQTCFCERCEQWMLYTLQQSGQIETLYMDLFNKYIKTKKPEVAPSALSTSKKPLYGNKVFTGEVYLTINPPNSLPFVKFKQFVEGLMSYDIYDDYLYAFEVTSNSERCPHVHIVMRLKREVDVSRKALRDAVSKGKIKWIKEYIDTKNIRQWCELNIVPGTYETTKNYVCKNEVSTSKAPNDVLTIKWRKENKIDRYYSKQP
jgi:hypothetical protein